MFPGSTAAGLSDSLSLHVALPIFRSLEARTEVTASDGALIEMTLDIRDKKQLERLVGTMRRITDIQGHLDQRSVRGDRKSTRLNSSHTVMSYPVFCCKKKPAYLQA